MWGGAGNDTLDASGSRHGSWWAKLYGGTGDDSIVGGHGRDTLGGGEGNDLLRGGANRDRLTGGTGDDLMIDVGATWMFGGFGNDTLDASASTHRSHAADLNGGAGNDLVKGGAAADKLSGNAGDDTVFGGGGDDTMFGNQGDDFFNGGYGADNIDLGEDIPLQVRPSHDVVAGTAAEENGDVVHNFNDADVIRAYGASGMTYRQVGDNTEVVIDGT
ncbi:MAG: calcium-binding protein, partial [Pseudomonadota bacterium]|nr:calcium-binding protein [Pseudomonadota bacterium]